MATKNIPTLLVLRAISEYRARGCKRPQPPETLREWTGEPDKVCMSAMERELRRGFVDYGVGLYIGWLTPEGESELKRLSGILDSSQNSGQSGVEPGA